MLTYTPKYGIYNNPQDDLLKRSRFLCEKGSTTFTSFAELEEKGIWFICKDSWGDSNMWVYAWVDNWGAVWKMSGSIHSCGGEPILREHPGFQTPLPDACIENIVSKTWPLPNPQQTVRIHAAVKAYVTLFLEVHASKKQCLAAASINSHTLQTEIARLRAEVKALTSVKPTVVEVGADATLDNLSSFFAP
jgi:hypothetical protein